MKKLFPVFAVLCLFLLTGIAFAQDEGATTAPPAATETAPVAEAAAPAQSGDYPLSIIDRPLTLPTGVWQLSAGIGSVKVLGISGVNLDLGFGYGLSDTLEIGIGYPLSLSPDFAWRTGFTPYAKLWAVNDEKLDLTAGLSLPLSIAEGSDLLSTVDLGVNGRYLVSNELGILFGLGLPITIPADPVKFGLGVTVPFGVEFQATPELNVKFLTELLQKSLTPSTPLVLLGKDYIPVNLTATYALSKEMDVGVQLVSVDAKKFSDAMFIGGTFAYRGF